MSWHVRYAGFGPLAHEAENGFVFYEWNGGAFSIILQIWISHHRPHEVISQDIKFTEQF
jgi:hypothetical protein